MPRIITVHQIDYDPKSHRSDPPFELQRFPTKGFLASTVGKGATPYHSHRNFQLPGIPAFQRSFVDGDKGYPTRTANLFIQTIHACFATHQGIGLDPNVIWQIIVQQVAEHIKINAARYAHLQPRQTRIEVHDNRLQKYNDWPRVFPVFEQALQSSINGELVALVTPRFSTTTEHDRLATLLSLANTTSPCRAYSQTSMCHLPLVRLEGTADDWTKLHAQAALLSKQFAELAGYFGDLLPVLQEIASTAAGKWPDNNFWSSLYKFKSISRSDHITGWITCLMAFKYGTGGPAPRRDFDWRSQIHTPASALEAYEIPSLLTTCPFTWQNKGRSIPMTLVGGTLGIAMADGVFTPQLGIAVIAR